MEKDAEKVGNQTLQNLENCVPVYTGAQFSFSPRHPQIVDFEFLFGFIGVPLPPFIEISGVCLGFFFLDRIYG